MAFDKGYPQTVLSNAAGVPYDPITPLPVVSAIYPAGAAPLAVSASVSNALAVVTLPAAAGKTTYISGFQVTASGATAASVVTFSVGPVVGNTFPGYVLAVPAGVTAQATPLIVNFNPPIPASAVNTGIAIGLPALGAGNTNAVVNAFGYQI